ncbi:hypothetical protein [Thermococcus sp.]
MVTFREALRQPLIKVGLLMLFLALILSLIAMISYPGNYNTHGVLSPGNYALNTSFDEKYYVRNRTLIMHSENASVIIYHDRNLTSHVFSNDTFILKLYSIPQITVECGKVNYTYSMSGTRYPYSALSIPAFILMIVGSAFAMMGYIRFMGEIKGGGNEGA